MPNAAKRGRPLAPLVQITWTTKKKDRTKTVMITLGGPVAALFLLFGTHFHFAQRLVRAAVAALGVGQ
jgi:hypothetical protein